MRPCTSSESKERACSYDDLLQTPQRAVVDAAQSMVDLVLRFQIFE